MPRNVEVYDSFAIESLKGVFKFVVRHPKLLLLTLLIQVITLLGNWIDNIHKLLFSNPRFYLPIGLELSSVLTGAPFSFINPRVFLGPTVAYKPFGLIFRVALAIAAGLIAVLGYPVLVSHGYDDDKIEFRRAFREGFARILDVVLYFLAMIGVAILLGLGVLILLWAFIFELSIGHGWIIFPAYVLISVYLAFRLCLVPPVLMLERTINGRKLGVKEAFTIGFNHTSGNVLSILAASILFSIIVLPPLNIIHIFVQLYFRAQPDWFRSFFHFGPLYWLNNLWETIAGFFGVFNAILPTVYYYTSVRKLKL